MNQKRVALIDGLRTPFGKLGTVLNDVRAQDLAVIVCREIIERRNLDVKQIDEVIFGNVCQPPDAANIARVISLTSGIPREAPALTVNRNCASGIESVTTAALKIAAGEADCILAGGTESMSNIPFFMQKDLQEILFLSGRAKSWKQKLQIYARFRPRFLAPVIGLQTGLTDPVCGLNMGQTAEVLAREFAISRREQDEFALISHQRAVAGREALKEEIVPVIPGPKYKTVVEQDNGPRENQTLKALEKLRPFFDRRSGTVTAGNSSQVTDGAVALLLVSEDKVREWGVEPLCYLRASTVVGVEPRRMGIGPAHAIPQVLKKAGLALKDIQAVEINEAFAVQVLACLRLLESKNFAAEHNYEGLAGPVNRDQLNVNGGAIALGHPVGATGSRLILTMARHMQRNDLNLGLVSLCVGGGQGAAVVLERA